MQRALGSLALLVVAAGCGGEDPPPSADPASTRTTAQGDVAGFAHPDHAAHAWKGIPFAEPPVGPLRWKAPRPPRAWEGTRVALVSGNECPQFDTLDAGTFKGEEDCLVLDVYAPRERAGEGPLPVMVWIHGGGNSIGSAVIFDGARLAAEGDVIVVSIQYRLGVLGWLSHPALRADAATDVDASGNYGTLDTIRALAWVQENIAAFGGDPGNVTIFGESAGGIDVFALLLSPQAEGLFHRAISQSGILLATAREEAESFADTHPRTIGSNEFLLRHVLAEKRADDRAGAKALLAGMGDDAIAAWLREKSAAELLSVFEDDLQGGMYFTPAIVRDGAVIPDRDPLEVLATPGSHNAVPTILGTNRDETKLFAMMGSPHVRRLLGLPLGLRDPEAFDRDAEYASLAWKATGADEPLEALRAGGRTDVYGYRFDWDEEGDLLWLDLSRLLGAAHGIEILFVFGFTDLGRFTDDVYRDLPSAEQLSARMRSYWTHFARTGAPGRGADGALPAWESWASDPASRHLVFDSEDGGGIRMQHDPISLDEVLVRLADDTRIASAEERCAILRGFVEFARFVDEASYRAFADGLCAPWPLEPPPLFGG